MRASRTVDDLLNDIRQMEPFECGSETAKSHFAFDQGYTFLNHGSYGTYPIAVRNVFRYYQERAEAQPDTFVRYEYRPHLLGASRQVIADYLEVPVETCVYTVNASMGVDTVLRNIAYKPGDVILCFSSVYGSFGYTIQHLTETTAVEAKIITLKSPLSNDAVVAAFESAIQEVVAEGNTPRIAVLDTISSLPGVRVPFERLTEVCRSHSILSCIDGAHAVGHFPLNLRSLDPDFFTSNLHKWLHVPRGCAILYVPSRNQHLLRTTYPTGFHFVAEPGQPNFVANFSSLGTLDDTPYLCIEAALEWRNKMTWGDSCGEVAIMEYTRHLAHIGGQAVAAVLGTEVLDNEDGTLTNCNMTNVRLPVTILAVTKENVEHEASLIKAAAWIQKIMTFNHKTAVNAFVYNGAIWVRLSAQVYLDLADFKLAGQRLKSVCERLAIEAGPEALPLHPAVNIGN